MLGNLMLALLLTAAAPTDLPPLVAAARTDLAQRVGVAVDDVEVALLETREWPSTALGLPEPGEVYAQLIVPGHQVVLLASGRPYLYHTGGKRFVRGSKPQATDGQDLQDQTELVMGRLVEFSGELFGPPDGPSLAVVAAPSDHGWVTTGSVAVSGPLLSAFARQLKAGEAVPVKAVALVETGANGGPALRLVTVERRARPEPVEPELVTVAELVAQPDQYQGRVVKVPGTLSSSGGATTLPSGEPGAAPIWLDLGGLDPAGVASGTPAVVLGLFERRKPGRMPGYGAAGTHRFRLAVISLAEEPSEEASVAAAVAVEPAPSQLPPVVAPSPAKPGPPPTESGQVVVASRPPAHFVASGAGFREGGVTFLPLRGVVECLGYSVRRIGPGAYSIDRQDRALPLSAARLRLGQRLCEAPELPEAGEAPAELGRQWLCLPAAPQVVAGRTYVPSEFIEALLGLRYSTVVQPARSGDWWLALPNGDVLMVPMKAE